MAKPIVTPKNSNTKLHLGASGASVKKETGTIAQGVRNSNARLQSSVQRPEPTAMQRAPGNRGLNSERLRSRMVERIVEYGVTDSVVLDAMRQVPRHLFVDEALASRAYDDMSLPIGAGQTISQPWIVAHMIALARNGKPLRKVLEIGTGCGYQAAVLSQVAKTVYSIERVELLYHLALTHLQEFGVDNVHTFLGDGMQGLVKDAPFDAIILAAAGLEVPPTLLNQLKIGGRLLAPVGGKEQRLILIERTGSAQWDQSYLEDVHFVPLLPGIYR